MEALLTILKIFKHPAKLFSLAEINSNRSNVFFFISMLICVCAGPYLLPEPSLLKDKFVFDPVKNTVYENKAIIPLKICMVKRRPKFTNLGRAPDGSER